MIVASKTKRCKKATITHHQLSTLHQQLTFQLSNSTSPVPIRKAFRDPTTNKSCRARLQLIYYRLGQPTRTPEIARNGFLVRSSQLKSYDDLIIAANQDSSDSVRSDTLLDLGCKLQSQGTSLTMPCERRIREEFSMGLRQDDNASPILFSMQEMTLRCALSRKDRLA